ncbi:CBU_0592 family membrane protein [Dactylosporangium salmoneum]|uniref:CBU-0592-like domain-containing protein n=1 Tax=Dactylosporangium salmoneum TaxID=53361 RepID=A0ABP5TAP3_9ACTN
MYDVVQIAGSVLILAAFVAALGGRLKQSSYAYLATNAIGSAALTVTAVIGREWGFILLEGVWALVSIYSIVRKATGQSVAAAH